MKKILLLTLGSIIFMSCNDFLDKLPDNRTKIDSKEKVQALLTSAYPDRTFAALLFQRLDGIVDHGATYNGTQPGSSFSYAFSSFQWDQYSPTESGYDTPEQYWTACYGAIAASNHAIAAINQINKPSEYRNEMAEARLTRAYAHYCLLTLYSNYFDDKNRDANPGIPFVDVPEDVIIKQYDRETVAKVLAKIKEDIDFGLKNIGSASDFAQPKFHFTKNAALAFAARVALFDRDYASVIGYVNQLIPNAEVLSGLTSGGNPVLNGDGSPVLIVAATDNAALYLQANLHDWIAYRALSGSTYIQLAFTDPKKNANILMSEVKSLQARAARGTTSVRHSYGASQVSSIFGSNITGGSWAYPTYSVSGDPVGFCPSFYEDFKVTSISANTGQPHIKIALFRLEEALLARAEAYAMTGMYQEALNDLNMYIQRRIASYNRVNHSLWKDDIVKYTPNLDLLNDVTSYINSPINADRFSETADTYNADLQKGLILTILDFRRTEFVYEGMRYFDILRWNIPVTHYKIDGTESTLTPTDDRRVLQIPQSAEQAGIMPNPYTNVNGWN